jgi:hypothetical protein
MRKHCRQVGKYPIHLLVEGTLLIIIQKQLHLMIQGIKFTFFWYLNLIDFRILEAEMCLMNEVSIGSLINSDFSVKLIHSLVM